jgi:hypothetical protein
VYLDAPADSLRRYDLWCRLMCDPSQCRRMCLGDACELIVGQPPSSYISLPISCCTALPPSVHPIGSAFQTF